MFSHIIISVYVTSVCVCVCDISTVLQGCRRLHSVLEDGRCAGPTGVRRRAHVVSRRGRCDATPAAGLLRMLGVAAGGRRGGRGLWRAHPVAG